MRIRLPFAGAFIFFLFASAYLGLTSLHLEPYLNDKAAHCITFFILTTCFYWILDTTRRRNLNLTLIICTAILGIGSEFLQHILPIGRTFDPYDILANIVGSLAALGLSTWYHKRMLERKRAAKHYTPVPGNDGDDLELGEGSELTGQESGIVDAETAPVARSLDHSLEAEVDNWDENAEDAWDEDPAMESAEDGPKTPSASSAGEGDHAVSLKKRDD